MTGEHGRLIDIPYSKATPVIFSYRQTAQLSVGAYNFSGTGNTVTKAEFTPSRPLLPNALYVFETISFSTDAEGNDYQSAIVTLPSFNLYTQAAAGAPTLREPVLLDKYFENYPYALHVLGSQSVGNFSGAQGNTFNKFTGSVGGQLRQTASLVGKTSITAVIKLTALEITDGEFIRNFYAMGQEARAVRNAPPLQGRQF